MLPPKYALVSTFRPIKVFDGRFPKKGLDKKKDFVVRDEAPYFSEALGFSLPSLLVNPALAVGLVAILVLFAFYTSKIFLKMAGGRMHTPRPHPTPLDPLLAISYRNHQKSQAHFNHLASLIWFFFNKRHRQGGGGMAQWPPF